MDKTKSNKIYILIIIIISLIGVIYSSFKILSWSNNVEENDIIEEELNNEIEIIEKNKKTKYNINFDNLKKQNSDTVGYIKVRKTNIDYVVVKTNNNDYYLTHNFKKDPSIAGWIFVDYHNKLDGSDKNIVIYGHSMLNKTMFGSLHNVLKKSWYTNKKNQSIIFVTQEGEYTYQVFSVYSIKVEDYYINTEFKNDEEYSKFLNTIKNRSKYNFKVDLTTEDTILTLSTCSSGGNTRTVLHAKLIKND